MPTLIKSEKCDWIWINPLVSQSAQLFQEKTWFVLGGNKQPQPHNIHCFNGWKWSQVTCMVICSIRPAIPFIFNHKLLWVSNMPPAAVWCLPSITRMLLDALTKRVPRKSYRDSAQLSPTIPSSFGLVLCDFVFCDILTRITLWFEIINEQSSQTQQRNAGQGSGCRHWPILTRTSCDEEATFIIGWILIIIFCFSCPYPIQATFKREIFWKKTSWNNLMW